MLGVDIVAWYMTDFVKHSPGRRQRFLFQQLHPALSAVLLLSNILLLWVLMARSMLFMPL